MSSTTFEIHPAIGVARVGSSRIESAEGYFIGPEPDGSPPAGYRDPAGDLKRQAARFRVFECRRDERNRLLGATEVTLDTLAIAWDRAPRQSQGSGPAARGPRVSQQAQRC